ncbi:MAG: hypothetical protein MMC33_002390 [Icmadophila ericetorum]|nr:hypothetical protein [Icmadophila ericetorum]
MRALFIFLTGGTCCLASSTKYEAPVYIFDSSALSRSEVSTFPKPNFKLPSISPLSSRLLFAQRLGLSRYHTLEGVDDDTLDLLSRFGSQRSSLFADENEELVKSLVIIEGIDRPEGVFPGSIPLFTVSNPPLSASNEQLVFDLLAQDRHLRGSSLKGSGRRASYDRTDSSYGENEFESCLFRSAGSKSPKQESLSAKSGDKGFPLLGQNGPVAVYHIPNLEETNARDPMTGGISRCLRILQNQVDELTVILMPPTHKKKKSQAGSYGTYTVLKPSSLVAREQPEEPLSISEDSSETLPTTNAHPSQPQTLKASAFPKTTLPICHRDNETCISTTNSCSGHGECYLKFTSHDVSNQNNSCWACRCNVTLLRWSNGDIQKMYWGGSACQKEDVSTPFWLIVSFTIVAVSTISWGIGMLYSIGQEELPSVIGAGVAGPRAHGN